MIPTPFPLKRAHGSYWNGSVTVRVFNIRLWFALTSLGAIVLISVITTFWLATSVRNALLERDSEVTEEVLESVVFVEGRNVFAKPDDDVIANPPLRNFARHLMSLPGILRANVWARDGMVLWSTDREIIGRHFDDNDELDEAMEGRRITEVGSVPDSVKAEHVALGHGQAEHFIEAYIPIREHGTGEVLGVVELYKTPATLSKAISESQQVIWISGLVAGLVLYGMLYGIVRRGARLIERQQHELSRIDTFAALGQMASAVAHSLRNPMATIRSTAELWRVEHEDASETAAEVIREVDRMDGYVRELLSYARAEPYHLRPVDPAKVVSDAVQKAQPALARNGIQPTIVDSRSNSRSAMADETLLGQALTSILTNATEAMPDGGTLRITLGLHQDYVRITVADSGAGMTAEALERVASSYFTTKTRGLGLGLAITKGIIERFSGRLEFASIQGVGTTVTVWLKAA